MSRTARDNLVSEQVTGTCKSGARRSTVEAKQRKKQSPPVWWKFTEKWDSDHPTTCCVWTRTRIERSLRPKLGKTQRKVVTENEVDAFNWECAMDHAANAIACNMHAEF